MKHRALSTAAWIAMACLALVPVHSTPLTVDMPDHEAPPTLASPAGVGDANEVEPRERGVCNRARSTGRALEATENRTAAAPSSFRDARSPAAILASFRPLNASTSRTEATDTAPPNNRWIVLFCESACSPALNDCLGDCQAQGSCAVCFGAYNSCMNHCLCDLGGGDCSF